MKREITKVTVSLCLDKKLSKLIKKNIGNKSKYIEWLIYSHLKKNKVNGIDDILI